MITVTVRTASRDGFLQGQGVRSAFRALLQCLEAQSFQSFELVYVDTYHEENREEFAAIKTSFRVKHVPIHPNHRYWYDQGWAYMAAATNTAIIHADGELIVSLDDAEFFDDGLLELYWRYYKQGQFMHACHRRFRSMRTHDGNLLLPPDGDMYINDGRQKQVPGRRQAHHRGSWLYAGKSFSLADALKLNGFDERCDGNCTLEDSEFGARLAMLGRTFMLDKEGWVGILEHDTYVDAPGGKQISRNFVAVENFGIIRAAIETKRLVANKAPFTIAELAIINRETQKYRKFDIHDPENAERLAIWRAVPYFDLTEERKALRA